MTETSIVDGEVVESRKNREVYVALWKKNMAWSVSGIMYYNIEDVYTNLAAFCPEQIVIVKVRLPEEAVSEDGRR